MHAQPSLCNLPDVVLRIICKKVGLKPILTLRRVCRDLRIRIDDIKPEGNLCYLNIRVEDNKIRLIYFGKNKTDVKKRGRLFREDMLYRKSNKVGQSEVRYNRSKKNIVNGDFLELALRDFQLFHKFQKKCIETIELTDRTKRSNHFLRFLEILKSFLAFENQLLKVQIFNIDTNDQKSVITALSLIDPQQSINDISIYGSNVKNQPTKFSEIMEVAHWKTTDSFSSNYKITGVSVHDFFHFAILNVHFLSISVEESLEIKKLFKNSTKPLEFHIFYDTFEGREQFCEKMGPPLMIYDIFEWYFRLPTTDDNVLRIRLTPELKSIIFGRVLVDYVPELAVIQD